MITHLTEKAKSWKTTICGVATILSSIGSTVAAVQHASVTIQVLAASITGLSAGLIGVFSRDNDKSSTDLGIK